MDTTLEVTPRTPGTKGDARKQRAKGTVPAIVYGPGTSARAVALDPEVLKALFKATGDRNTVIQLKVGGEAPVPCLVREVQKHPVSREILHVDFYAVPSGATVEVMVPVEPVGRPKGLLVGGRLRLIRRELKVRCPYDGIPSKLTIDVSDLELDTYLRASQVPLPAGVALAFDNDFNVVGVVGRKAKDDLLPETPKPAAAEGAEGAAAEGATDEKKED